MITKTINIQLDPDSYQVLDNEILKTASDTDMFEGYDFDPDFVYAIVRSISAGEYWGPNNNTDYFEEIELLGNGQQYGSQTGYKTFLEAHVFKNHANKDVAGAIGDVIKAEWDDYMKAVNLFIRIDKVIAPTITRGFLKGTITDVSMGCRVDHVVCSICGNRAKTRKDYCEHLRDPKLRGKILTGGKRVYEINKGPRYHDISVVTKGADRTAKASRVIDGQKAVIDQDLKKVASFTEKISSVKLDPAYALPDNCRFSDRGFEKVASEVSMMKKAEVEKILTGNIVAIAGGKAMAETGEKVDDVMEIMRLFHTKHFDQETSKDIAEKINVVASERKRNPMDVFKTFLRTSELAGIELSPLEFSAIKSKLDRKNPEHLFNLSRSVSRGLPETSMKTVIRLSRGDDLPSNPSFRLPGPEMDMEELLFNRILKPFMGERSIHRRHLRPRVVQIIKMASDEAESLDHYVIPLLALSKTASEELKSYAKDYVSYQDGRVEMAINGDVEKYAAFIDGTYKDIIKTASGLSNALKRPSRFKTNAKRLAVAYPAIYGYSKYQKAKIDEGRRVGSFNKYVADNPGSAFALAAVGGIAGQRKADDIAVAMKGKKLKRVADKAAKKAAKGASKLASDEYLFENATRPLFLKEGSSYEESLDWLRKEALELPKSILDLNILTGDIIEQELTDKIASDKIEFIKEAIYQEFIGNESEKDAIIKSAGLSNDDVNLYLKAASNVITDELNKIASETTDVAKDTLMDTIFYPQIGGAGTGAMLPGSIIDGFVIGKAIKHFEKKNKANSLDNTVKQPETAPKIKEVK